MSVERQTIPSEVVRILFRSNFSALAAGGHGNTIWLVRLNVPGMIYVKDRSSNTAQMLKKTVDLIWEFPKIGDPNIAT